MSQLITAHRSRRKRLALLLPGRNEELIVATTIQSALAAGLRKRDIYVVDDGSTDNTRTEALTCLPAEQILSVPHGGKARAVKQAIEAFDLVGRYEWLHVADADSVFCADYFKIYKKHLDDPRLVAAVGMVQSMRGNWIALYRSFSYTYGQHIFRRLQSWLGIISVLPGPVTCFRTDIIKDLDFTTGSLTEDFDLTLQIHRKHLGRIRFIPEAVNFTQDPRTLKDFYKQNMRWQRGFFQGVRKYKIGLRPHRIDFGIGYQMSETLLYFLQFFVFIPAAIIASHNWLTLPFVLALDFIAMFILAIIAAFIAKRPLILLSLSYFYVLRLIELFAFVQAFVEVIVLRKFKTNAHGWETGSRRYKLSVDALKDIQ